MAKKECESEGADAAVVAAYAIENATGKAYFDEIDEKCFTYTDADTDT